jgi:hypothetical protein
LAISQRGYQSYITGNNTKSLEYSTAKLVEKNKKIRLASAKKTIEELEKKEDPVYKKPQTGLLAAVGGFL